MRNRNHLAGRLSQSGLLVLGIVLLSVCAWMLATMDQRVRATEAVQNSDFSEDYARFSDVLAETYLQLEDKYVEDVDRQKLFEGALNGMFQALDAHSSYLGADNFKELERSTEGEFSGIGVHIGIRDGVLTVISPIPGTPAARAGLKAWDRIVEIEGESTEGMTDVDAVKRLTGPTGTEVTFKVYRESERRTFSVTIIRDRIMIESVYSNVDEGDYVTPYFQNLLDEGIGYARLTKFSEHATEHISKVLDEMIDKNVQGLILDLRWNSGGLLDEGISATDLFLEKDKVIVATKGRIPESNKIYQASKPEKVDWPIVLLVNEGSASASEIMAGALKDHKRAVLVGPAGKSTFGKGSVQTITPLSVSLETDANGNDQPNALRITTAKFYSPANAGEGGQSISGVGIEPDLSIEVTMQEAADLLTQGVLLGEPPLNPETDEEAPSTENVQEEAAPDAEAETETQETEIPDGGEEEIPFYMRKSDDDVGVPGVKDSQLRYAVDILRALLIAEGKDVAA